MPTSTRRFRQALLLSLMLATPSPQSCLASDPGRLYAAAAPTNVGPAFEVSGYEIRGNTILAYEQMEPIFKKYVGSAVTLDTIRQALSEFQLAYRQFGYVTVGVSLPRQQLTNGLVKVQVTEGRLSDINIVGNRYYSAGNIRRSLPSLKTNVLLNTKWFQPELDLANANTDRQIYPVIGPGPDPGTSALTLKVKDRLPLHGHVEFDNRATPGTPPLRLDTAIQYNNLWQQDHQAGAEYNFSPENMKTDSTLPRFWDQPLIASYSGFYRILFGSHAGLRESYDKLPVDFGYDQVSHQFHLPPATGHPELIFYGSRSTSESFLHFGPITPITQTVREDITSQSSERDLTLNENVGARLTLPLREFKGWRSALSAGLDYKYYQSQTFSTNLTFANLYSLDQFGNRVLETNSIISLDSFNQNSVFYVPLALGWSGSRPDAYGSFAFNISQNIFLSALSSSRERFQHLAGSKQAGGNFTTLNAGLSREQKLFNDWSLSLRANGQWASAPLINNEQFGIGGTAGVRGYQEGEEYGDSGWRALAELRAPPVSIGELPNGGRDIPVHLRSSAFLDYGERYLIDPPPSRRGRQPMLGAGFSVYATAGQYFDARLTLAWAALTTPGTKAGQARAYFSLGIQF